MMVTVKKLQETATWTEADLARLIREGKAPQFMRDMQQELARVNAMLEALKKEGKRKLWDEDAQKWVIVDAAAVEEEQEPIQQVARPKTKLPDVPSVMHDERLTVLSNHTIHAALASFHSAQSRQDADWHRGEKLPTFIYQKENGTVFIELRPQGKKPEDDTRLTEAELAQAWALLTGNGGDRRVTSLTGIVLYALLAHALDAPPDATGNRWITAEQVLDYRNRQKVTKATPEGDRRTAGHRTEDIEEIGAVMNQLDSTWVQLRVKIIDDTDSRGRKRQRVYTHHSKIIAISSTVTQKEILPDSTSTMPIAWGFSLGSWAEPFLEGANRFTAEIPQQCLSYNPYHEMWELRLSEYFARAMRTNAKNGSTITREIGLLINELSLPINDDDPKRTRQSFETAMNRIRDDGVIASWRYQGGEPKLKRYGWLSDWQLLSIEVTASNGAKQQYRQIAERSATRRQRAEALEAAKQAKQKGKKND